jgi:hypothetical protein
MESSAAAAASAPASPPAAAAAGGEGSIQDAQLAERAASAGGAGGAAVPEDIKIIKSEIACSKISAHTFQCGAPVRGNYLFVTEGTLLFLPFKLVKKYRFTKQTYTQVGVVTNDELVSFPLFIKHEDENFFKQINQENLIDNQNPIEPNQELYRTAIYFADALMEKKFETKYSYFIDPTNILNPTLVLVAFTPREGGGAAAAAAGAGGKLSRFQSSVSAVFGGQRPAIKKSFKDLSTLRTLEPAELLYNVDGIVKKFEDLVRNQEVESSAAAMPDRVIDELDIAEILPPHNYIQVPFDDHDNRTMGSVLGRAYLLNTPGALAALPPAAAAAALESIAEEGGGGAAAPSFAAAALESIAEEGGGAAAAAAAAAPSPTGRKRKEIPAPTRLVNDSDYRHAQLSYLEKLAPSYINIVQDSGSFTGVIQPQFRGLDPHRPLMEILESDPHASFAFGIVFALLQICSDGPHDFSSYFSSDLRVRLMTNLRYKVTSMHAESAFYTNLSTFFGRMERAYDDKVMVKVKGESRPSFSQGKLVTFAEYVVDEFINFLHSQYPDGKFSWLSNLSEANTKQFNIHEPTSFSELVEFLTEQLKLNSFVLESSSSNIGELLTSVLGRQLLLLILDAARFDSAKVGPGSNRLAAIFNVIRSILPDRVYQIYGDALTIVPLPNSDLLFAISAPAADGSKLVCVVTCNELINVNGQCVAMGLPTLRGTSEGKPPQCIEYLIVASNGTVTRMARDHPDKNMALMGLKTYTDLSTVAAIADLEASNGILRREDKIDNQERDYREAVQSGGFYPESAYSKLINLLGKVTFKNIVENITGKTFDKLKATEIKPNKKYTNIKKYEELPLPIKMLGIYYDYLCYLFSVLLGSICAYNVGDKLTVTTLDKCAAQLTDPQIRAYLGRHYSLIENKVGYLETCNLVHNQLDSLYLNLMYKSPNPGVVIAVRGLYQKSVDKRSKQESNYNELITVDRALTLNKPIGDYLTSLVGDRDTIADAFKSADELIKKLEKMRYNEKSDEMKVLFADVREAIINCITGEITSRELRSIIALTIGFSIMSAQPYASARKFFDNLIEIINNMVSKESGLRYQEVIPDTGEKSFHTDPLRLIKELSRLLPAWEEAAAAHPDNQVLKDGIAILDIIHVFWFLLHTNAGLSPIMDTAGSRGQANFYADALKFLYKPGAADFNPNFSFTAVGYRFMREPLVAAKYVRDMAIVAPGGGGGGAAASYNASMGGSSGAGGASASAADAEASMQQPEGNSIMSQLKWFAKLPLDTQGYVPIEARGGGGGGGGGGARAAASLSSFLGSAGTSSGAASSEDANLSSPLVRPAAVSLAEKTAPPFRGPGGAAAASLAEAPAPNSRGQGGAPSEESGGGSDEEDVNAASPPAAAAAAAASGLGESGSGGGGGGDFSQFSSAAASGLGGGRGRKGSISSIFGPGGIPIPTGPLSLRQLKINEPVKAALLAEPGTALPPASLVGEIGNLEAPPLAPLAPGVAGSKRSFIKPSVTPNAKGARFVTNPTKASIRRNRRIWKGRVGPFGGEEDTPSPAAAAAVPNFAVAPQQRLEDGGGGGGGGGGGAAAASSSSKGTGGGERRNPRGTSEGRDPRGPGGGGGGGGGGRGGGGGGGRRFIGGSRKTRRQAQKIRRTTRRKLQNGRRKRTRKSKR